MSSVQSERVEREQMSEEIIVAMELGDWAKLQSMAGDKGLDIKDVAGVVIHAALSGVDSLGRRNKQFGVTVEDETHIVLSRNTEYKHRSSVHGVFTNRESAELFLDALQQQGTVNGIEFWIVSVPLNQAILKWWSVRYQFNHKPGWSVLEVPGYQMDNPYSMDWFEGGISVMVVADSEEDALKRGRSMIKSKL